MKTLEQINREFIEELAVMEAEVVVEMPAKEKKWLKRLSDVLFYLIIAIIIIVTLVFGGKTHEGFHLLGYSGFTVLSGSMQREIPEGSLVITKAVDPDTIKIGDDITFVRSDNAIVTHRVVNIIEDYSGNSDRGFQTQGLENPEPDSEIVFEGNIIGKVKFSAPELGYAIKYISEHIGIVFLILGGILAAVLAFNKAFAKREE